MTLILVSRVLPLGRCWCLALALSLAGLLMTSAPSMADESGLSFWLPGFFGSLSAAPLTPGWSLTTMYYHTDVSASGNAALSKQITVGQFNPTINISLNAQCARNRRHRILDPELCLRDESFWGPICARPRRSLWARTGQPKRNLHRGAYSDLANNRVERHDLRVQRSDPAGLAALECRCQ